MEKIKKGYNFKIVLVIISILFLCNTTLCSYTDPKDTLRVPLISSSKEGHVRFEEAERRLAGEPNELSGIITAIGSILMSYQCDGRKSALTILEELKKAGVDEKCFILMKEPNMVLHYRSFIEFYKKQKDDLRLVSLEELRQRFIKYLGEIVIYRADLYTEKKMQEVREFGCLSKFLRGNGTFSEMAKIINKLGILCTAQATMDEERVISSSGEVLYDGRKERLYNSVSIVDPGAKDQHLAEKRAEALARQVANSYIRANLIDEEGILDVSKTPDEIKRSILKLYKGRKIMVVKARVPRFYLIEQIGHGKALQAEGVLKPGFVDIMSKIVSLQVEKGKVTERIDQFHDPYYEGLIDYISAANIESVTLYPLDEGIGFVLSISERQLHSLQEEAVFDYVEGLTEDGRLIKEMDWKTTGERVDLSQSSTQTKSRFEDKTRWAAYRDFDSSVQLDHRLIAEQYRIKNSPSLYGDPRDWDTLPSPNELYAKMRRVIVNDLMKNGFPKADAIKIASYISVVYFWGSWEYVVARKLLDQAI